MITAQREINFESSASPGATVASKRCIMVVMLPVALVAEPIELAIVSCNKSSRQVEIGDGFSEGRPVIRKAGRDFRRVLSRKGSRPRLIARQPEGSDPELT